MQKGTGVGVDILEIARMQRVIERSRRFVERVFTAEEIAYCESCTYPAEHFAARFAAREAILKALGTGFSQGIGLKDVSVVHDAYGRPQARLQGRAEELAREQGICEIALSLSHTREVAAAFALAITPDQKPPVQKPDARQLLAVSFKEARKVLDDLDSIA